MTTPSNLKYSAAHAWARREADGMVVVGITDHAQETLGDLVYVECPALGRHLKKDEVCAIVESVKAASDVYAPVSGEVIAVNVELADAPEKVNADAYAAWMFKLKPADPAEFASLLDAAAYQKIADADQK